jgi:hypothetical protein
MTQDRSSMAWRRSSRCADGMCVEVAVDSGHVLVRNSMWPDLVLTLSAGQWTALVKAVKAGCAIPQSG